MTLVLTTKLTINQGLAAGMPTLDIGELALATDTHDVYIGTGAGNVKIGPSASLGDGDKGDITVSSSGTVWTIDANAVTYSKMQAISTNVLLGNDGSGSTVEEIPCTSAGRALIAGANASGQRTTLGLALGSDVQAWDADLDALAALAGTNTIYYRSGANTWSPVTIGSNLSFSGGTLNGLAGTVTSVAISVPGILSITGSPITSNGTLALTLTTQTANTGFFGPTTGAAAAPAFRTMVTADIPDTIVTYAKLQNVSATSRILGRRSASAGVTEECTLSQILDFVGSAAQGDILYRGAGSWSRLPAGTSGQVLQTNGTGADPSWASTTASGITGEVRAYSGFGIPSGWLACDGSAVSRTTYAALFAALNKTATVTMTIASPCVVTLTSHGFSDNDPISFSTTGALPTGLTQGITYLVKVINANTFNLTSSSGGSNINTSGSQSGTHTLIFSPHGNGDGSTTFNLPDGAGKAMIGPGLGSIGGTFRFMGMGINGEETHLLTTGELPAHSHAGSAGNFVTSNAGGGAALAGGTGYQQTATTANAGGGGAHNNMQPSWVGKWIIKT